MIRASLEDVVIEPQRQALIPGFGEVREASLAAGALGCSISGAGPTVFAWALESRAAAVLEAMKAVFVQRSIETDDWIVDVQSSGARIIDSGP
jgi:homoserine kinase